MDQASITMLSVSLIISAVILLALPIFLKLMYGAYFRTFFAGAAAFLIVAYMAGGLVIAPVLQSVQNFAPLVIIFSALIPAVFEIMARFWCVRLVIGDHLRQGITTPLMYGAGHVGAETVLIGINAFWTLSVMLMISTAGLDGAVSALTAADAAADPLKIRESLELLIARPASGFLPLGIERLLSFIFGLAASVIVYPSATGKGSAHLYMSAILLSMLYKLPVVLFDLGIISNIWISEALLAAVAAAAVTFAVMTWKKFGEGPPARRQRRQKSFEGAGMRLR